MWLFGGGYWAWAVPGNLDLGPRDYNLVLERTRSKSQRKGFCHGLCLYNEKQGKLLCGEKRGVDS